MRKRIVIVLLLLAGFAGWYVKACLEFQGAFPDPEMVRLRRDLEECQKTSLDNAALALRAASEAYFLQKKLDSILEAVEGSLSRQNDGL